MQPLSFNDKVSWAKDFLKREVEPGLAVVLSSFGKDSMVLLGLLEEVRLKLPVLSFREPFHREKYRFADRVIKEKELVVYDYPPMATGLVKRNEKFEVINFHQIGSLDEYMVLPTGVVPPSDGRWVCVREILDKPVGLYRFPWKQLLIGHKASDKDPIWGEVSITEPKREQAGKTFLYPLIHFTDADVWDYHRSRELPIHVARYNPATGEEWPDKRDNPDYFPCCTNCVDRDNPEKVFCPKVQGLVKNASSEVQYLDPVLPSYIGRKNDA